jgi:hypothetical protein
VSETVALANSRSSLTHRQSGAERVVASVLGLPGWVQAWLTILSAGKVRAT